MKEEEYIKTRLDKEISWHEDKCNSNKNWFNGLRLVQFISAAIIPFWQDLHQIFHTIQ